MSGSAAPEFKLTQVTFFILDFSRCILLKEELESEVYSKVIFFDIQVIVNYCQPTSRFVLCVGWSEKVRRISTRKYDALRAPNTHISYMNGGSSPKMNLVE